MRLAIWHGSHLELRRLERAINVYCTCTKDPNTCPAPHRMLTDQRTVDHLVFALHQRDTYLHDEFIDQ